MVKLYRSREHFDLEQMYRSHHLCVCAICGERYGTHPPAEDKHLLSYDGKPFLHRLCNGDLVKL